MADPVEKIVEKTAETTVEVVKKVSPVWGYLLGFILMSLATYYVFIRPRLRKQHKIPSNVTPLTNAHNPQPAKAV